MINSAIFPEKLKTGDEIRIVAPARSLSIIKPEIVQIATARLESLGLNVSFAKHVKQIDLFNSSSIAQRVEDLHQAFADTSVRAILSVIGGFNSNQLLRYLDYDLIRNNPKILCGYSDITALSNAIYAKTGLVTYSGMSFASLGMEYGNEYSLSSFYECLFQNEVIEISNSVKWSDDAWYEDQSKREYIVNDGIWILNSGSASGQIIGGNLCTLNLLQGTEYMPDLTASVLFIEDDYESHAVNFDRDLQSLVHLPSFSGVKAVVIGRFQKRSNVSKDQLIEIVRSKKELQRLPVIANVDFGHTSPMFTFPIGGKVSISTDASKAPIVIERH